jgi:cadmium resistance protein CadD (predicted permease)
MASAELNHSFGTCLPALLRSSVVAIAIVAFVSTNVDDLFLLVSLFIDAEFRKISVVVGQFVGMSMLVVISIFAALFAMSIPGNWIWSLGFAPLLLGINRLWKLIKQGRGPVVNPKRTGDFFGKERLVKRRHSEVALVTVLTMANGGDNVTVYIPLFSVHRDALLEFVIVFGLLTMLWCVSGYYLTRHRLFGDRIKRYARFVIPFILIGIGLNILSHR